ncbi:MAG: hypothetical protein ACI4GA_02980, partial [Acutalibacteraceae bacterium]
LSNDGMSIVYQNLISPVYGIVCAVNAILNTGIPTRIELENMLHDIDLGTWVLWSWIQLKIPVIDWLKLARLGAASVIEKRTSRSKDAWSYSNPTLPLYETDPYIEQYIGGKYVKVSDPGVTKSTQTYIVADKADVLVTVLRWVLNIFDNEDNINALTDWVAGLFRLEAGGKEIVKFGIEKMMEYARALKTTDAIIGAFFSAFVTFVSITNEVAGEYNKVKQILNDIFSELAKCDSDCWYANVADAMQAITGCWKQTVGTDSDYHEAQEETKETLNWFQKIIKAIKDFFAKLKKLFTGK